MINVQFHHCPIPSTSYSEFIFGMNLTRIEGLYIVNGISEEKTLREGQFEGLETLSKLILIQNDFETIQENVFKNISNLLELRIQNNDVHQLNREIFIPLSQLTDLELEQSNIKELPDGLFDPLKDLKYIKIRVKSKLTPNTWKINDKLKIIQIIDLDASQLSNEWSPFQNAPNLENVTISGTGFGYLPKNLFMNNPKLEHFIWTLDRCLGTEPACNYTLESFVKNLKNLKTFRIGECKEKIADMTEAFVDFLL